MEPIAHICERKNWEAAQRHGFYKPDSLDESGFIHCSRPTQVGAVANLFFDHKADLVLLTIDPRRVLSEIRWEVPADLKITGHITSHEIFPHIYGILNLDAVISVEDLTFDENGILHN